MLSRHYNWMDISIQMKDKKITGARSLSYESRRESKNIYALGGEPIAYGNAKKEYKAKIGLLQSEIEILQKSLKKGKGLCDMPPFEVVVVYAYEGGATVTDILKHCRILSVKKEMKVDDEFMEVELPLAVGQIQYNV